MFTEHICIKNYLQLESSYVRKVFTASVILVFHATEGLSQSIYSFKIVGLSVYYYLSFLIDASIF